MDRSTLVPVSVACPCPGTPHADGDSVFLYPKLGLQGGVMAERKVREMAGTADPDRILAVLTDIFVQFGVADWTFVDDKGKPVEVTPDSLKRLLLDDWQLARLVADKADELYTAAVLDPLTKRRSAASPQSSTGGPTPPSQPSGPKRQKRPKPSSTSTTQTGVTATTSV